MTSDFLRDRVEDVDAWRTQVRDSRARCGGDDPQIRLQALGRLGDLLRIGGQAQKAIAPLEEALSLAREHRDERAIRANRLRLAIARQYANEHVAAQRLLEELVNEIEAADDKGYLDFAVQHLGKVCAEQEQWERAISCFRRALALRSGDPRAESSRIALEEALSRGEDGSGCR